MNSAGQGQPGDPFGWPCDHTNTLPGSHQSGRLKPCPFCGCKVKLVVDIWGIHGQPNYMTVYHPENDCILSDMTGGWSSTDCDEIIGAWNRRAGE